MDNIEKTICTCNVKDNAVLIAKILDRDIDGDVCWMDFYEFVNDQRETFQNEYESYIKQYRDEEDSDKRFRLQLAMGVLKRTVTAFDNILYTIVGFSQEEIAAGGDIDAR